jgi:hypothetical protein
MLWRCGLDSPDSRQGPNGWLLVSWLWTLVFNNRQGLSWLKRKRLTYIRDVPGHRITWEVLHCFPQFLKEHTGIASQIMPLPPFPSTSFPIHYSLVILSFYRQRH